jgi:hypothetical protein
MLHFPSDKPKNVYIGVYKWGIASCGAKKKSSLYGYATKAEMEANIVEWKYMATKLFYTFEPQGSQNLLDLMQKKELYLKAVNAYSIGVMARQI